MTSVLILVGMICATVVILAALDTLDKSRKYKNKSEKDDD